MKILYLKIRSYIRFCKGTRLIIFSRISFKEYSTLVKQIDNMDLIFSLSPWEFSYAWSDTDGLEVME